MRKVLLKALLLFSSVTCVLSVFAQVGEGYWSYSNPKPFGFSCNAVSFIDDNTGIAVGYSGGIAKTTDGGANWAYFCYTLLSPGHIVNKPSFYDVQFVSPTIAYAVGTYGAMIKSLDGGVNWSLMPNPFYADSVEISSLYFFNETTGYIVGDTIQGKTSIYFTNNGGNSWTLSPGLPEEGRTLFKIRFSPNGVGYVTGLAKVDYDNAKYSSVLWKLEAGIWKDYSIDNETVVFENMNSVDTVIYEHDWDEFADTILEKNLDGLAQASYMAIAVINDTAVAIGARNNGMMVRVNTSGPQGIYWLINLGSSSNAAYNVLGSGFQNYNLACKDGQIIAGASSNGFLYSPDKGWSWTLTPIYNSGPEEKLGFNGVDITPGKRYVLAGENGAIADSITSWRKPYKLAKMGGWFSSAGLWAIDFLDAKNGIGVGDGGTMLITKDGGNTWEDKTTPGFGPYDSYIAINYLAADNIALGVNNGGFYKSADQGESLDLYFQAPPNGSIADLQFVNADTGFMAANINYTTEIPNPDPMDPNPIYVTDFHHIAYYTTDGGLNWDSAANPLAPAPYQDAFQAYDMDFLNSKIGFMVGTNGGILKTTDGGHTWVKKTNIPANVVGLQLESVDIITENIVYAVGWSGTVIKTVNGGETWTNVNNGLPTLYNNFIKVLAYDTDQVMVFSSGDVYTTKDGGDSWTTYYATLGSYPNMFSDACFAPMENCNTGVCRKVFVPVSSGHILKFDSDRILPVKFSKLTAFATAQGNQLFWTSFSQKSVQNFVVEGSANGISFTQLSGKIATDGLDYQSHGWRHTNAPAGKYYYRVKAIEKNGAAFYTNIVSISSIKAAGWKHQVSNGTLILNNTQAKAGSVNVQVVNTSGQLIAAKNWKQNGGVFNNLLLLPANAHGIHYVKLVNEGTVYSFRILIQ